LLVVRISIILPGVQITTSAPFLRSVIYPYTPAPPYTHTQDIPNGFPKVLHSL